MDVIEYRILNKERRISNYARNSSLSVSRQEDTHEFEFRISNREHRISNCAKNSDLRVSRQEDMEEFECRISNKEGRISNDAKNVKCKIRNVKCKEKGCSKPAIRPASAFLSSLSSLSVSPQEDTEEFSKPNQSTLNFKGCTFRAVIFYHSLLARRLPTRA